MSEDRESSHFSSEEKDDFDDIFLMSTQKEAPIPKLIYFILYFKISKKTPIVFDECIFYGLNRSFVSRLRVPLSCVFKTLIGSWGWPSKEPLSLPLQSFPRQTIA
jgi:hypothetical protein